MYVDVYYRLYWRYEEVSEEQYYIVKKKALPEVLLKVVEAKRLDRKSVGRERV